MVFPMLNLFFSRWKDMKVSIINARIVLHLTVAAILDAHHHRYRHRDSHRHHCCSHCQCCQTLRCSLFYVASIRFQYNTFIHLLFHNCYYAVWVGWCLVVDDCRYWACYVYVGLVVSWYVSCHLFYSSLLYTIRVLFSAFISYIYTYIYVRCVGIC